MTDAKELDRSEDACRTPDPSSGFGRRSGSRMRRRRPLQAGVAVGQLLLIVGLTACAAPTAHVVDAARPVVAACALLTTAQRQQVGVNPGVEQSVGDERGGCVWKSFASSGGLRQRSGRGRGHGQHVERRDALTRPRIQLPEQEES
jgi:hypothetical protein